MTKTHEIIPITDGYVVIDKEATNIKEGFVVMQSVWNKSIEPKLLAVIGIDKNEYVIKAKKVEGDLNHADINGTTYATVLKSDCSGKVIASIGIKIEGVPLIELPDEGDLLAEKMFPTKLESQFMNTIPKLAFIKGYKANTKQYSEEDLKQAYLEGAWDMIVADDDTAASPLLELKEQAKAPEGSHNKSWNDFIKSLQKVPISIELEYEVDFLRTEEDYKYAISDVHKATLKINPDNTITPIKITYNENI